MTADGILSANQAEQIAKALAEPRRVEILRQLGKCETCTPCAAIQAQHEVTAATLSHHMKELEDAGLITIRREGKFAFLSLQRETLAAYLKLLGSI